MVHVEFCLCGDTASSSEIDGLSGSHLAATLEFFHQAIRFDCGEEHESLSIEGAFRGELLYIAL